MSVPSCSDPWRTTAALKIQRTLSKRVSAGLDCSETFLTLGGDWCLPSCSDCHLPAQWPLPRNPPLLEPLARSICPMGKSRGFFEIGLLCFGRGEGSNLILTFMTRSLKFPLWHLILWLFQAQFPSANFSQIPVLSEVGWLSALFTPELTWKISSFLPNSWP